MSKRRRKPRRPPHKPSADKVSIAYLHPGEVRACFHESLIDMLFYDANYHGRFNHPFGKMGKWASSAGVPDARNHVTKVMLDESDSAWLFMIDSDMGFAPDTVERLIESAQTADCDVMGGLCFAQKSDGKSSHYGSRFRAVPTLYDFYEDDDTVGFIPRFGYADGAAVQMVAATGAACVLISRRVLEEIRDKYGDVWFDPINHPKGARFSEDMSFCVRVAGCVRGMAVDTSVTTTHDKGGVFLDEEYFGLQQMVRHMVAAPADTLAPAQKST